MDAYIDDKKGEWIGRQMGGFIVRKLNTKKDK